MVPRASYPPVHHHPHLTKSLTPAQAQEALATFLTKTAKNPYLHPDALLSGTGIQYPASSGPNGGLAIHHLRRIEAGLRGENLVAETADDLRQFQADDALPEGDDALLDAAIEGRTRRKGGLKRSRSSERVNDWEDGGFQAALRATDGENGEGWQDLQEFELEQQPLEGEVGEREGAPVVVQNGVEPEIVEHDDRGEMQRPASGKKAKTDADKAARRAAKAERSAKRKQKAEEGRRKAKG